MIPYIVKLPTQPGAGLKDYSRHHRRSTDPYKDGVFLSAIELWYRLRDGVRIPAHTSCLPDHTKLLFCAFMFVCFKGDDKPLADYMAGVTSRGLTIRLKQARDRFYRYGLNDVF